MKVLYGLKGFSWNVIESCYSPFFLRLTLLGSKTNKYQMISNISSLLQYILHILPGSRDSSVIKSETSLRKYWSEWNWGMEPEDHDVNIQHYNIDIIRLMQWCTGMTVRWFQYPQKAQMLCIILLYCHQSSIWLEDPLPLSGPGWCLIWYLMCQLIFPGKELDCRGITFLIQNF